ncbi:FMN-binding protein [Aureliella helgolandensis]|uniref:Electron transport complex subunit RsxG n=1 Tax=Aureliella helgolandensis TaxID=2527968 RepID=A0A518G7X6_9BACT|nr:FMN-binding protein [Aureliella helgolandensis]QDV24685.1 Electron transport complex subunit RsxG [Aureliella helgolandensis]
MLPIINPNAPAPRTVLRSSVRRRGWGDAWLHTLRIALLCGLIGGLQQISTLRSQSETQGLGLSHVVGQFPSAREMGIASEDGLRNVRDASENSLGWVATTSPEADRIIGYSGPNNVLIAVDEKRRITGLELLSSGDTQEHADLVRRDEDFWQQFVGQAWEELAGLEMDGVSGATLTSLAIAEALALRTTGKRLSLRFPDPITLDDARLVCPKCTQLQRVERGSLQQWEMYDASQQLLGTLVRTGPLVDSVEGYQGPTELVMWLSSPDADGVPGNMLTANSLLEKVKIRSSYDNEPYVGYVRQEYGFWPLFAGRSLKSLGGIDLEAEKIEGVSGATMTSLAVAETIGLAATRIQNLVGPQKKALARGWNWSVTELATAVVAVLSLVWCRSHWRGRKWPRRLWQLGCFVILGIGTGNLLSIALFAGWTTAGVGPMLFAPGLAVLLAVALVSPVLLRQNVYCDHLCPHGALQQWARPLRVRIPHFCRPLPTLWGTSISRLAVRALKLSRGLVILAAIFWTVTETSIALTWLEPFDTYAWKVGVSASIVIWLLSLLLVLWRPMSYCQLACPTGHVLGMLKSARRTRHSLWIDVPLLAVTMVVWTYLISMR